jgi:sugar fermentation stimulation protein A
LEYPRPLVQARFLYREKRFFIHAELPDGTPVIAHTNNTGRMSGCLTEGGRVWLSPAENPRRKLKWTLEISESPGGVLVGVNTAMANLLAAEALKTEIIPQLAGYTLVRAEVPFGTRGSRADFLLDEWPGQMRPRCWLEVKNVSLVTGGHARFPDAPTARGRKHLLELAETVARGDRAALLFCAQRSDAVTAGPADDIDPEYGQLLRRVAAEGVEVFAVVCRAEPAGISVTAGIPVTL